MIFKPGLDPYLSEVRLLQISTPYDIFVIDTFYVGHEIIKLFNPLFRDETILKIFHNAKFDMKMLMLHYGATFRHIYCTMLGSQILANGIFALKKAHNLKDAVERYLGIVMNKEEQRSDWSIPELTRSQIDYAAMDVDVLPDLCVAQLREAQNPLHLDSKTYVGEIPNLRPTIKLECNCCIATARVELDGVYVNPRIWNDAGGDVLTLYYTAKEKLIAALNVPNINLESPAQVKRALNALGAPVTSTNEKYLAPFSKKYPQIALLLDYRGYAKLLSSYGPGIPGKPRKRGKDYKPLFHERIHPITGRIHSEFKQMGTETGRYSCTNPNIQQVPKMELAPLRRAFTGQIINDIKNSFIVADYSQFEMRIIGELSQDPSLLKAFALGGCIHTAVASLMFKVPVESIQYDDPNHEGHKIKGPNYWMRNAAKTISFGLAYGRGAASVGEQIDVSRSEAQALVDKYFVAYLFIKDFLDKAANNAVRNRYIETPGGRIRYFQRGALSRQEIASIEREGKNTPIQGCNADITKRALYLLHCATEHLIGTVFIVNVIHDEFNVEAPPHLAEITCHLVKEVMEEAGREYLFTVPVIAEAVYGEDWSIK